MTREEIDALYAKVRATGAAEKFKVKTPVVQKDSGEIEFNQYLIPALKETGVPRNLLKALAGHESAFKKDARGFDPSTGKYTSAYGYMQLLDSTADELGVDNKDPAQNVLGGARYLKKQLDEFKDVERALVAYFKGPGVARQYKTAAEVPGQLGGTTASKYVANILKLKSEYDVADARKLTPDKLKQIAEKIKQAQAPATPPEAPPAIEPTVEPTVEGAAPPPVEPEKAKPFIFGAPSYVPQGRMTDKQIQDLGVGVQTGAQRGAESFAKTGGLIASAAGAFGADAPTGYVPGMATPPTMGTLAERKEAREEGAKELSAPFKEAAAYWRPSEEQMKQVAEAGLPAQAAQVVTELAFAAPQFLATGGAVTGATKAALSKMAAKVGAENIAKALPAFSRIFGKDKLVPAIIRPIAEGLGFGSVESVNQMADNIDQDRPVFEGVAERGAKGVGIGATGAVAGELAGAVVGKAGVTGYKKLAAEAIGEGIGGTLATKAVDPEASWEDAILNGLLDATMATVGGIGDARRANALDRAAKIHRSNPTPETEALVKEAFADWSGTVNDAGKQDLIAKIRKSEVEMLEGQQGKRFAEDKAKQDLERLAERTDLSRSTQRPLSVDMKEMFPERPTRAQAREAFADRMQAEGIRSNEDVSVLLDTVYGPAKMDAATAKMDAATALMSKEELSRKMAEAEAKPDAPPEPAPILTKDQLNREMNKELYAELKAAKSETQGAVDAETVRVDEGQVQKRGATGEAGEGKGGEDVPIDQKAYRTEDSQPEQEVTAKPQVAQPEQEVTAKPQVAQPKKPPKGAVTTLEEMAGRNVSFAEDGLPSHTFTDQLQKLWVDKMRRQEVVERTPGVKVTEESSAFQKSKLMGAKAAKQLDDFNNSYVEPMVKDLGKNGIPVMKRHAKPGDLTFEDYLYAKHAPEANKHIADINERFRNIETDDGGRIEDFDLERGSGMSNDKAMSILDRIKASGKEEVFERNAKKLWDLQKKKLDILEESGRFPKEVIDRWRRYQYYIPLKGLWTDFTEVDQKRLTQLAKQKTRTADEAVELRELKARKSEVEILKRSVQEGSGRNMTPTLNVERRMGRKSEASDILSHAVADVQSVVLFNEKNKVMGALKKFIEDNPAKDLWEINEVIQKPVFNRNTGEVEYKRVDAPKENAVPYYENGKRYDIYLKDAEMLDAFKGLDPVTSNVVVDAGRTVNRYFSSVITKYNPTFWIRNLPKDVQTALATVGGEYGGKAALGVTKNVVPAMNGVRQYLKGKNSKWASVVEDYKAAGGSIESFGGKSLEETRNTLERTVKLYQKGTPGAVRKAWKNTLDFVDNANATIESGTRVAVYKALLDVGYSKQHAALASRNVTVDFGQRGKWSENFGALYLFFNPNVQGTTRMFKSLLKSNKTKGIAAGIATASFSLAQMNRMNAGEDDDGMNRYDKIPDGVKRRYWVFVPPEGMRDALSSKNPLVMTNEDGLKYLTIPLAWGYNVFHSLGVSADKMVSGGGNATNAAVNTMLASAEAFNPVGSVYPTVLRPFIALKTGEDEIGRKIRKPQPYGIKRSKAENPMRSDSEWSQTLAKKMNQLTGGGKYMSGWADVAPGEIDYILNTAFGGTGKFVLESAQMIANTAQGKPTDLRRIPFLSSYVGQTSEGGDERRFNDLIESMRKINLEYKSRELEDSQRGAKFYDNHEKDIEMQAEALKVRQQIEAINKQIRELDIEDSDDERIKGLEGDKKVLISDFMFEYNTY